MPRKKTVIPSSKPAAPSSQASPRPKAERLDDATLTELVKVLLSIRVRSNREEHQE